MVCKLSYKCKGFELISNLFQLEFESYQKKPLRTQD